MVKRAEQDTVLADAVFSIPHEGRCTGTSIRKAMRRVSQLYDTVLASAGVRATQYSILMTIGRMGSASVGELSAALTLDRSTMGHNLRPLERSGLVIVCQDPGDRRTRMVTLSKAGRAKLAECGPLWAEAQRRFDTAFGVEESAALRARLDYIASPDFESALGRTK